MPNFGGHIFANKLGINRSCWAELVALAANGDFLLLRVKLLELASDVFGFTAAGESRSSEGSDHEGGEDGFHSLVSMEGSV